MHQHLLPQEAKDVLLALTHLRPAPRSVWLFGSRANGRVTRTSDTDLLVFADRAFVESLLRSLPAQPQNVDVLVVVDDDALVYPWRQETVSLKSWEWQFTDAHSASYVGTTCTPDDDLDDYDLEALSKLSEASTPDDKSVELCHLQFSNEQALRVFPVDA